MKRQPNETIEAYRKRRSENQTSIKNKLKGRMFYDHREHMHYPQYSIKPILKSYKKPKDIERQTFTKALRNANGYANHLANKTFAV